MGDKVTYSIDDRSPAADGGPWLSLSRRSALRLLVSAAVLPPVLGALPAAGHAAPAATTSPPGDALRRLNKPDLRLTKVVTITGRRHRVTFHHATWTGGQTYVRDVEVRHGDSWLAVTHPDRRFDEQWLVLTGDEGSPNDYYSTMTPNWVAFDSLRQVGARTVELHGTAPGVYHLTVRWNLDGDNPELHWTLEAGSRSMHYVVGYQSFDTQTVDAIDEVLCGTRQHARVIEDAQSLGAWELMAPMSLTQRTIADTPVTLGVYVPGEVMAFEHERELGPDGQPFGMSLRNDERAVQPVVFAPQAGRRSPLKAGERRGYAFGIYAQPGQLYSAYTDLVHNEYGYTDYRRNVYNTSLTQAVYNMIDLLMIEPDRDDSVTFVPSFSGWWYRAKGFVDIENDQAVRTPTAGVLLSAYYLTGNDELYHRRARPMIEYHLSRANIGSTPVKGKPVYGSLNNYRIGRIPGDASTLVPLYQQTRGQNAGIHRLAMDAIKQRPSREGRTPMSTPLQAYVLTGNAAYLAEAKAEAHRYLRDNILTPYTTNQGENGFGYHYSKAWTELLVLYELTGERAFLDASHHEAKRFVTETQVRPVPDTTVSVPRQPFIDSQLDRWHDSEVLPEYPKQDCPTEKVPAWMVFTSGVTFEQLSTYKIGRGVTNPGGGFSMIPVWAPFLLRLSQHTGDRLLREVAHNLVIGRFTNYPGYYNRQHSAEQMKPDFPLQGPPGVSCIYYHHIPGQLGMALDYLITEQVTRSGGRIDFPRQFETNYVFFRYYTYGHAAGEFYGDRNVWPYFPKGIVTVSSAQVNWITAVGNGKLYLSLSNESAGTESIEIRFSREVSTVDPTRTYQAVVIKDNGARQSATVRGGKLATTVSGKGITAVIVDGVDIQVPWQWTTTATDRAGDSYHIEDIDPNSDFGLVRAILLARPNRSGYDVYVQIDTETPATLYYSVNGGPRQQAPTKVFPYEWTIPVPKLTDTFTCQVVAGNLQSQERTLRLPPSVTGVCTPGMAACGELSAAPDTTGGDTVRVRARVRNGTDAALANAAVSLTVPSGWSATAVGQPPVAIPAKGVAAWEYNVAVPAGAEARGYELTAAANWDGGRVDLAPSTVEVLTPVRISALSAAPTQLAKPGDSTKLTIAVLNVSPVNRTGSLRITVPSGWVVSAATVSYNVPGRSEREYTVTATAPATAPPGSTHRITATVDGGPQRAITVPIAGTDIVVDNTDLWPRYAETGFWMPSGLTGWNGSSTRYSEEGRLGGTATWRPDLPADGEYDVAVWYPTNPDTTTAAVYVVHHAAGEQEFTVNQQENANGWRHLGRFRFTKGTDGYVRIVVRNPGFHRVDAARFLPV